MELHEKNLKRIIEFIEEFGIVEDINIKNTATYVDISKLKGKPTVIREFCVDRPKEYTISFRMGDIKESSV